jgi:hypothetical protein
VIESEDFVTVRAAQTCVEIKAAKIIRRDVLRWNV